MFEQGTSDNPIYYASPPWCWLCLIGLSLSAQVCLFPSVIGHYAGDQVTSALGREPPMANLPTHTLYDTSGVAAKQLSRDYRMYFDPRLWVIPAAPATTGTHNPGFRKKIVQIPLLYLAQKFETNSATRA
uniref:Uncharacterized protein n=1 Tax=Pyricularia oryzae (strain P131) TaxID=1143193 RepID=L7JFD2_PYRO1